MLWIVMYSTFYERCVHYQIKHFERMTAACLAPTPPLTLYLYCAVCLSSVICASLFFIYCYLPLISKYLFTASPLNMSTEEKMEVDNRSIYVGNVSDNT
jgi:hypothetical protein